ncbi:MAG: hypothetical protein U1E79_09015 [Ottowia sp.]|nr:hypothetical protein [Pseudomonadota bacterium]
MNQQPLDKVAKGRGFIAALDQNGEAVRSRRSSCTVSKNQPAAAAIRYSTWRTPCLLLGLTAAAVSANCEPNR